MDALLSFIENAGYKFSPQDLDGRGHTIVCELTGKKIWYIGERDINDLVSMTFGSWEAQDKHHFKEAGKQKLSKEEKQKRLDEKKAIWAEAARIASVKYSEKWTEPHVQNYLATKGFQSFDVSFTSDYSWAQDHLRKPMLMLPMRDTSGKMWNVQFVQNSGHKSTIARGRGTGLFNLVGKETTRLIICEGYSTALTVHLATGVQTLCAFGLSNIKFVMDELKKAKWEREFIVCVDNDHEKFDKKTKLPQNPGHIAMAKLKKQFGGVKFVSPKNVIEGESDYNDVMNRLGLSAVTDDLEIQLGGGQTLGKVSSNKDEIPEKPDKISDSSQNLPEKAAQPEVVQLSKTAWHIEKYVNGIAPMPAEYNAKGTEVLPGESKIAEYVMEYYRGRIIASEGTFFLYKKTHWMEIGDTETSELIQQFMVAHNGKAGIKRYESCLKLFYSLVPRAPRNLFIPNPYLVNLLNGTLHIRLEGDKWNFKFETHNKLDYCTNVIPIEFDPSGSVRNEEFESMVLRLLGGDTEKVRVLKQIYGACLAPIFPRLFMLHGPPGSGKSSLIIGAKKLVFEQNVAQVQPGDMEGFHLESLIGRLVNVVTDIDLTRPIKDSVIKQIEDRIPIPINRKFKSIIIAPIPAVHIFGGNDVPSTLERGSGAHTRRWTFLKINTFKAENDNYSRDFASRAFDRCPAGVLNFALEGLKDLIESNGLYYSPVASKEAVTKWQTQNDAVSSFIEDIKNGEVPGMLWAEDSWANRAEVWRKFKEWYLDAYSRSALIPKGKFFSAVEKVGGKIRKLHGEVQMRGFEVLSGEEIAKRRDAVSSEKGAEKNTTGEQNRFPDVPY